MWRLQIKAADFPHKVLKSFDCNTLYAKHTLERESWGMPQEFRISESTYAHHS